MDLEGIVAKYKYAPYTEDREQTTWVKILNRHYSQKLGRLRIVFAWDAAEAAVNTPNFVGVRCAATVAVRTRLSVTGAPARAGALLSSIRNR
jgi:hypothetical protein